MSYMVCCTVAGKGYAFPNIPISYSQVVRLAGEKGRPRVTYRTPKTPTATLLTYGDAVVPVADMIFDVAHTTSG